MSSVLLSYDSYMHQMTTVVCDQSILLNKHTRTSPQAHSLSLTSYSTQSNHLSNTISLSFFFTLSLSLYYFQSACNKSLFSGEMDDRAAAFC